MRKTSVFGVAHGRLICIHIDVEEDESPFDGLERFDRDHGTDLVQRWRDGEWNILPDLIVDDRETLDELIALLDDPDGWDDSLPEGWTEGRR